MMTRHFASRAEVRRFLGTSQDQDRADPAEAVAEIERAAGFCPHCRRDLDGGPGGVCSICVSGRVNLEPARTVLAGSPLAALDYATAYRLVFRTDLAERCRDLVAQYGDAAGKPFEDGGVCWELGLYDHTPAGVLAQLDA